MKASALRIFFCLIILNGCIVYGSYAQSGTGLYIGLNGGYGLPLASENLPLFWRGGGQLNYPAPVGATTSRVFGQSGSWSSFKGSYGNGGSLGLDIGYTFSENLGVELGVNYLLGTPMEVTSYLEWNAESYGQSSTKMRGRMLRFIPTIVLTVGNKRFNPYMKAGVVVGVLGEVIYDTERLSVRSSPVSRTETSYTWRFYNGVSFGFSGVAGIKFKLNRAFSLFAEMPVIIQSYAPTKGRLTSYVIDGDDQLPNTPTAIKEIQFVYKLREEETDSETPSQQLKIWHPFSSIGFGIGIQFRFGMKKKNETDAENE